MESLIRQENMSMGPVLIWVSITIVVNVPLQDIGIDKSNAHSKKKEGNCRKNVVVSNIQIQMIYHIPLLLGKWNSHTSFIHILHMTTNKPFPSY